MKYFTTSSLQFICRTLIPFLINNGNMIPCFQAMEYLLQCRRYEGESSPREFYAFLNKFQTASRWILYIDLKYLVY